MGEGLFLGIFGVNLTNLSTDGHGVLLNPYTTVGQWDSVMNLFRFQVEVYLAGQRQLDTPFYHS